ncbi:MAG: hypothetical protein J7M38_08225 [Armatimonadetes bacterium]|nr:hypothetical protein [Armatimonadota bacterium]
MKQDLTRREVAAALLAAAPALAVDNSLQAPAAQGDPLAAARKQLRRSLEKMEEFDLPMPVEPAFIFKP